MMTINQEFQTELQRKLEGLDEAKRGKLARRVSDNTGYCATSVPLWFDGVKSPNPVLFDNVLSAVDQAKKELSL